MGKISISLSLFFTDSNIVGFKMIFVLLFWSSLCVIFVVFCYNHSCDEWLVYFTRMSEHETDFEKKGIISLFHFSILCMLLSFFFLKKICLQYFDAV